MDFIFVYFKISPLPTNPITYTSRYELCHITLKGCPQLGTDEAFCFLAVVDGAQYSDGTLHVECCEVLQSGKKEERREVRKERENVIGTSSDVPMKQCSVAMLSFKFQVSFSTLFFWSKPVCNI